MKESPAVANLDHHALSLNPAPGVYDTSGVEHAMAQLDSIGKPYRTALWVSYFEGLTSKWLN